MRWRPCVFLALIAAVALWSADAWAQFAPTCDSCAGCTQALAGDHARVELTHDLDAQGATPCIVVGGDYATLNGRGHILRAGAVGVRVVGRGAQVRNLQIGGPGTGVVVASPDAATLYRVTVGTSDVGIAVEASAGVRIVRSEVHRGHVGIAFGTPMDDRCPTHASVRSPGAVIVGTRVDGAGIGIAACDAMPVLTGNTVTNNRIGVLLGAPEPLRDGGPGASEPYDPCVCAPTLDRVNPSTTLMWSSGCGGCEVHEAWLPDLHAAGADIRLRETGDGSTDADRRFDDYTNHCAPELTDAVGLSGSVPNYGCVSSGHVWKLRMNDTHLTTEAAIAGPNDLARFASECSAEALRRYGGASCVRVEMWNNHLCGNHTVDLRATEGAVTRGGADNACTRVEGWTEGGHAGCTRGCEAADAAVDPPTQRPTPRPTERSTDWGPLVWMAGLASVLGIGALALGRSGKR